MKFIFISDTHGQHRKLDLPEGDVIVHSGDFCHYGSQDNMYDFLEWYDQLNYTSKILIGGNHDFFAYEHPEKFKEYLPQSITYLCDSGTTINSIKIWGSPYLPDLVRWAFGHNRGIDMKKHWDLIPSDVQLLITHTPPYGYLDQTRSGKSIGCEELTKRMEALHVDVHVFGHVHASYGQVTNNGTRYINASNMSSGGGLVNLPVVVEI
ncbi:MAG: metallophosphatase domain-containing protein [Saprospiraceae bacterium]|nr:metallophosphatase domain-containing protein [Saprospiraceae bacterium]